MQLRRIGSYRGIEYIVRLTERGLRYAMVDANGLTAVMHETVIKTMPSELMVKKSMDFYLDECALEWK